MKQPVGKNVRGFDTYGVDRMVADFCKDHKLSKDDPIAKDLRSRCLRALALGRARRVKQAMRKMGQGKLEL